MPHMTKIKPPTEPWEFHKARQKAQQEDLKVYLRGRPLWRSCIMLGGRKHPLQGTYVMPTCELCGKKEKHCLCMEIMED